MKIHRLNYKQYLPITLNQCWDFFSDPKNLSKITPAHMGFDIKYQSSEKMHSGMIIEYRVKPLFNLPLMWVTEITHSKEREYFVDEQRFGPYKFWHHQHIFRESRGGVVMEDIINYALPYGFFGGIVHALYVRKSLEKIFHYRQVTVSDLFNVEK